MPLLKKRHEIQFHVGSETSKCCLEKVEFPIKIETFTRVTKIYSQKYLVFVIDFESHDVYVLSWM